VAGEQEIEIVTRCALNGKHTSEEWAAECPLLGRNRDERIAAWRAQNAGAAMVVAGRQETPPSDPSTSATSRTVFRHGRAGRSGRPKVDAATQRRKQADRQREYRRREKQDAIAANDALLTGAA
jgi:hypothetical protein